MFFIRELERTMTLHPSFFGSHVEQYLKAKLHEEMEGNMLDNYYIICIIDVKDIQEGRVVPGTGYAEYNLEFRAVVWKPFKGEVVRLCFASPVKLYPAKQCPIRWMDSSRLS